MNASFQIRSVHHLPFVLSFKEGLDTFISIVIVVIFIIIVVVVICHQLDLDTPVSASPNSLFKGLPNRLRPFGL
jgi:hypothetical protein